MACRALKNNERLHDGNKIRNKNLRDLRKFKKKWGRLQAYGDKPMNDMETDRFFDREYRLKLEAEELECDCVHCRICPLNDIDELC